MVGLNEYDWWGSGNTIGGAQVDTSGEAQVETSGEA